MSCADAKLSLIKKASNNLNTKEINGIDRIVIVKNLNQNPDFSVSIKDRFETTLSLNCPMVGLKIAKVIEKLTNKEIP